VSKFQHHMEARTIANPLADIEEIGNRDMQWRSHLDKKLVELRQCFPQT